MPPDQPPAPAGPVLILDDSPLQSWLLGWQLDRLGFASLAAADRNAAESLIARRRPCLLLVELLPLAGGNGFEDGSALMERHGIPAVLMSASGRPTDRAWAARLGFAATLARPASPGALRAVLETAGLRVAGD